MKINRLQFLITLGLSAFCAGCISTNEIPGSENISFPRNSSELSVEGKDAVLRSAQKMACLDYSVYLVSDPKGQGKGMANKRLNEVKAVLEEAGISKENITTGFEYPQGNFEYLQDMGGDSSTSRVTAFYTQN